jgi:hypothetical protein
MSKRIEYFEPYLPGRGPKFRLALEPTGRCDEYGKHILAYCLEATDASEDAYTVLFEGEDFYFPGRNPLSDSAVEGIMCFLTLHPGDTDAEYFASYTAEQRDYCAAHAETLYCEVQARFCDENGAVINRE